MDDRPSGVSTPGSGPTAVHSSPAASESGQLPRTLHSSLALLAESPSIMLCSPALALAPNVIGASSSSSPAIAGAGAGAPSSPSSAMASSSAAIMASSSATAAAAGASAAGADAASSFATVRSIETARSATSSATASQDGFLHALAMPIDLCLPKVMNT
nr:unnamed protein product [Digitaria exilis]